MSIDEFNRRNGREWMKNAACAKRPDINFFVEERGGKNNPAKKICSTCVVKTNCLEYAIKNMENFGIWGGMGVRMRQKIRRQRKNDSKTIKRKP